MATFSMPNAPTFNVINRVNLIRYTRAWHSTGEERPNANTVKYNFTLASGPDSDPVKANFEVNQNPKARGGKGETKFTIRLETSIVTLEGDGTSGDVVDRDSIEAGIYFHAPGIGYDDHNAMRDFLSALFCLTMDTQDPGIGVTGEYGPDIFEAAGKGLGNLPELVATE